MRVGGGNPQVNDILKMIIEYIETAYMIHSNMKD